MAWLPTSGANTVKGDNSVGWPLSLCACSPLHGELRIFWISKQGSIDYAAFKANDNQWLSGTVCHNPDILPHHGLKHADACHDIVFVVRHDGQLGGFCWPASDKANYFVKQRPEGADLFVDLNSVHYTGNKLHFTGHGFVRNQPLVIEMSQMSGEVHNGEFNIVVTAGGVF
ncbi:hypothetical protein EHS25_007326 [Saitozyma podzolica]|uniref:Uncharacterized protein n=1 Tax=Saitozyma podzolica TaxID=1890683 RepID=A0A427XMV9_9TREE|nr:hypothetical protein EHS25_007326 [Saitozyma podzolica]